ncbi:MAG: hypothetical protein ACPHRO_14240, partial [Nannocystaceae bacterium]
MRVIRWTAPLLFSTLAWSSTAHASPYSFVLHEPAPSMDPTADAPAPEGPATGEVDDAGTPDSMDPTAASEDEGNDDEGDEAGERDPSKFNRHAIGVRTGLVLTPTWGLS